MYIHSLGMRGIYSQTVQKTDGGTGVVGKESYDTVMRKALEKQNAAIDAASVQEGDMVITQPFGYSYQSNDGRKSVASQEKSGMSMEEYRQWFRNEVSDIRSETYAYSPYISDTLVIKEEAFEKMKNEPEWEEEVLGKIRKHCLGQEISGTKAIGYQIIDASPEKCCEEGIPVGTGTAYPKGNIASPYAAMDYSYPYVGTLYANPLLVSGGYWNSMLAGQTGFSNALASGLLSGQNSLGMLSSAAYRNVMNGGLGSSLLGDFMI